jgi:MFS family permease
MTNATGFRRLWLAAGASNLADGILFAGLPVLAVQVTDSPAAVAGVTVALLLPMATLALPAGVLADRVDRRTVLVAGNAVRALGILAVLAAVVAGELRLAAIYAVAAIAGGSEILVDTTAQTAVPALVGGDRLEAANARLGGTQVVMNDAVGAPIGSFLAGAGAGVAFGVPVVLFAVAAVLARRLPTARPDRTAVTGPLLAGLLADVREGAHVLARHAVLRRLAIVNGVVNLGATAFTAVFVLLVVGPLGLPPAAFGWYLAALAAGGILGSLVAGRLLRRLGHAVAIRAAAATAVGTFVVATVTSDPWLMAATLATLGFVSMVWNVGSRVLRQTLVDDRVLGRVTATMALIALVATPLGGLLGGAAAELVGIRAAGGIAIAANLVALALLTPVTTAAVEAARAAVRPSTPATR